MAIEAVYWYSLFAVLLAAFFAILSRERESRWLFYFVFGAALGFFIDLVSVTNGYYSYPAFYHLTILGLPFSMTLAEGFSVSILIWLFEKLVAPLLEKR